MPRIDADTVAEHRARQREALLDAAERLLLDGGWEALDFRLLGERTGLRRNSVYRYFASRDQLVAELCERGMPAWLADVDAAVSGARSAAGAAAAYVRVQLEMVGAGRHRLAQALAHAPLSAETVAAIHALPGRGAARLEEALAAHGHPRPHLAAQLVTGLLNGAIALLHEGEPASEVTAAATAAARHAVRDAAAA